MLAADLNLTIHRNGVPAVPVREVAIGRERTRTLLKAMETLGGALENMHHAEGPASAEAFRRGRFQLLRAQPALSGERDIPHPGMSTADGLVRLECETLEPLLEYESGLRALLEPLGGSVETLSGVQRPRSYTSHAMTQYAYARAQQPGPGTVHQLGVVTPMNKNAQWWAMDWMHRESFFLPRYDAREKMVVKGHALAADAGIASITRRLVHSPDGYGSDGNYDFVGYFEFAEADAAVFSEVMAALRDTAQNPEWAYIKEGPEWWGRRVASPQELWKSP